MKKMRFSYFLVGILIFTFIPLVGCAKTQEAAPEQLSTKVEIEKDEMVNDSEVSLYGAAAASEDEALTVEKMLVYAIQDEYLAHGEYAYILETFGDQTPFNNIIKAEEEHISSLEAVFKANNYTIPEDLSANYLIVPESVNEALETGVEAEIVNIDMYQRFLEQELPDDVKNTFTALKRASESHLKAFQNKLGK